MTAEQTEPKWDECFALLRSDESPGDLGDRDDAEPVRPVGHATDLDPETTVAYRLPDWELNVIRRGRRLLARPHGSLSGPNGDPSDEEIKAMTAAIRATWSKAEQHRRSRGSRAPVDVKMMKVGG